jgi:thioredoxin reductase
VLVDGYGQTLLLATGVIDHLPSLSGIERFYGKSVHHCPYCDGWEWRDAPIAVYGRGDAKGAGLAATMTRWSSDVVLFTDGPAELSAQTRALLRQLNVAIREERIARLDGDGDALEAVVLANGERVERRALFFNTGQHRRAPLAERLGCAITDNGGIRTGDDRVSTSIAGVYVAGDASRDVQLVIVAAAEGAEAAIAINKTLLREDGISE